MLGFNNSFKFSPDTIEGGNGVSVKDTPEQIQRRNELYILRSGNLDSLFKYGSIYNLTAISKEFPASLEIQDAVKEALVKSFLNDGFYYVLRTIEAFSLSQEFLSDPVIVSAAERHLIDSLLKGHNGNAERIIEMIPIPNEFIGSPEVQSAAEQGIMAAVKVGTFYGNAIKPFKRIADKYALSQEFFTSPEMISAAEQGVASILEDRDGRGMNSLSTASEIVSDFHLSESFSQKLIKEQFIDRCNKLKSPSYFLEKIMEYFPLPREFFALPEIQEGAKQYVSSALSNKYQDIQYIQKMIEYAQLPESFTQPLLDERLLKVIQDKQLFEENKDAIKTTNYDYLKFFPVTERQLGLSEIETSITKRLRDLIGVSNLEEINEFVDVFSVPKDYAQPLIDEMLSELLLNHSFDFAREILDIFPLSDQQVKDNVAYTLRTILVTFPAEGYGAVSEGDIAHVQKILQSFPLAENDIRTIAGEAIVLAANGEEGSSAGKIFEVFKDSITEDFLVEKFPGFKESIRVYSEHLPQLIEKAGNDVSKLFGLYLKRDTLNEVIGLLPQYPWMSDAFSGNERYAEKLIFKFGELDDLSKQNIDVLYRIKKEIAARGIVDENSFEFRVGMQQELLSYLNNENILNDIQSSGLLVEPWLAYEHEAYFKLGNPQEVSFAEMVQTPVERITETLSIYKDSFKKVFGEYRKELQAYRIPLESSEDIQKEVSALQEQLMAALESGNEKRMQGLQKGMQALERRIDNPKTAPLWQKLTGNIDAIMQVGQDVEYSHGALMTAESQYQELLKKENLTSQDRQDAFSSKRKIDRLLHDLREKLTLLEMRMKQFTHSIKGMTVPCLGEDRSVALTQELNDYTFEALDHFTSDVTSSQKAFEKAFSAQEKNSLEGRFMKVGLWGRNPDRDLYLGNYTDCCIRIDSEHMGEESTIADYLTDLGMQVVTVMDEVSNEPIVAAWVYIGDNNGKPEMVIDNIEANRDYVQYFGVIKDQLEKYIFDYALNCGLSKGNVSQGSDNNDIILDVQKGEGLFMKMGGYNRIDGYYLEAEPDDENDIEEDEEYYYDDEDE